MVALRLRVYVHFAQLDGVFEAWDVASAKECVQEMYPNAVFSGWQTVDDAEVIVAWANPDRRIRDLTGRESDETEPDAYVICQAWPIGI